MQEMVLKKYLYAKLVLSKKTVSETVKVDNRLVHVENYVNRKQEVFNFKKKKFF